MHFTATFRAHPPPLAAGVQHFSLDDDDEPPAAGSRPDRLSAVSGPQERVLRHTVEQMADSTQVVPMLQAPAQQLGCSVVGSVLGRWEPLPPQARVQSVLEQAAGRRPGSAGGCQTTHGDAGDGLVRGPSESVYSHEDRVALHRVADASVSGSWDGCRRHRSRSRSWRQFIDVGSSRCELQPKFQRVFKAKV